MKRKILSGILSFGLVLAIFSCKKDSGTIPATDNLYVPTVTDVTANATLAELQSGRSVYSNKCGACHGLYSADSFSATSWKGIVSNMVPRAGLASTDAALVYKYVSRGK